MAKHPVHLTMRLINNVPAIVGQSEDQDQIIKMARNAARQSHKPWVVVHCNEFTWAAWEDKKVDKKKMEASIFNLNNVNLCHDFCTITKKGVMYPTMLQSV